MLLTVLSLILFILGAALGLDLSGRVPLVGFAVALLFAGTIAVAANAVVSSVADSLNEIADQARELRPEDAANLVGYTDTRRRRFIQAWWFVVVGCGLAGAVGAVIIVSDLFNSPINERYLAYALALGLGGVVGTLPSLFYAQGVFRSVTAFRAEVASRVESEKRRQENLRALDSRPRNGASASLIG